MNKQTEALNLALEALEEIDGSVKLYHRLGPHWTHKDGTEVFEVSVLLDRSELIEKAITSILEALAEESSGTEQREHLPTRRAVERELERLANHTGMHLNDGKERVTLPGGTLRRMLNLIDRASPPAQRKPLTKTKVGNYLRRHAHGEVGMYRNGFKDGVAFAEAAHGIKENV